MTCWLLGACATRTVDDLVQAEWVELRSDHFIIYSEVGEDWPRRMLSHLEQFRKMVIDHVNLEGADNPLPLRIVLMQDGSGMHALANKRDVFGLYQPTYRGGLALIDVSARAEDGTSSLEVTATPYGPIFRKKTGTRLVSIDGVLHEYVHHLLANDTRRRYPLWFNEGYAEYLSTFTLSVRGDSATIGAPPPHRLESLQQAFWMPLDVLFRSKGYETAHGHGDLYAQAWAVVHYMMAEPERAIQADNFLTRLNDGEEIEPAFEAAFGVAMREMSGKARSKVRSRRIPSQRLDVVSAELGAADIRVLAPREVSTLIADIMIAFGHDLPRAKGHLQEALSGDHDNARARALLAKLDMFQEKYGQAERVLSEASLSKSNDPDVLCQWGHFYMDRALDAVSSRSDDWRLWLKKARRHYQRAIDGNQHHAEALIGLGRSYMLTVGEDNQPGINALEAAFKLLPTHMETPYILGHLLFAAGEVDMARIYYEKVISWSRQPDKVARANEMLQAIEARKENLLPLTPLGIK